MKKIIFSIKDNVTGNFDDPFFMTNRAEAVRALKAGVNSAQETKISKFAADLALYEVGEFDIKTGETISKVEFVVNAIDLKD